MQDGIVPGDNLALDMGCCIGGYTMYMGCCCSLLTPFACMDSPIIVTDRGILNSK